MKLPSPAMFVSVGALVVALGGTSYAAVSINGANIKAQTIDSSKIKKNSLGSGVIKDGKITAKDIKAGEVALPAQLAAAKTRWAFVGTDGQIKAQSGGFSIVASYPVLPNTAAAPADNSLRANGNVYINAGEDLADNGLVATIALQNTVDQNGDGITTGRAGADQAPEFSGEISISRCNIGAAGSATATGPTNCAPAGAQNATSFVVSPRLSDGTPTGGADGNTANRKAFYVVVTGS